MEWDDEILEAAHKIMKFVATLDLSVADAQRALKHADFLMLDGTSAKYDLVLKSE